MPMSHCSMRWHLTRTHICVRFVWFRSPQLPLFTLLDLCVPCNWRHGTGRCRRASGLREARPRPGARAPLSRRIVPIERRDNAECKNVPTCDILSPYRALNVKCDIASQYLGCEKIVIPQCPMLADATLSCSQYVMCAALKKGGPCHTVGVHVVYRAAPWAHGAIAPAGGT